MPEHPAAIEHQQPVQRRGEDRRRRPRLTIVPPSGCLIAELGGRQRERPRGHRVIRPEPMRGLPDRGVAP